MTHNRRQAKRNPPLGALGDVPYRVWLPEGKGGETSAVAKNKTQVSSLLSDLLDADVRIPMPLYIVILNYLDVLYWLSVVVTADKFLRVVDIAIPVEYDKKDGGDSLRSVGFKALDRSPDEDRVYYQLRRKPPNDD